MSRPGPGLGPANTVDESAEPRIVVLEDHW